MSRNRTVRFCPQCRKPRHFTAFDSPWGVCFECRQDAAFQEDNNEWLHGVVRQHEVDLRERRSRSGVRENWALDSSMLKSRQEKVAITLDGLLAGDAPHGIDPQAWRITQAMIDGRSAQLVASEEMIPQADVEVIERETMTSLYKLAEATTR